MAKLVFASPETPDATSGPRRYAARLLAELSARRHEATFLPLPNAVLPADDGAAEIALKRLHAAPPEAMLMVDARVFGALPVEGLLALKRPVAAFVSYPGSLEPGLGEDDARRLEAMEKAAFGAASIVVATSAATKALLIERFAVAKEKTRVAEPGVDPASRARGGGEDGAVVLTVGALCPRKNQITLARALGRLMDLDWRWRVVGRFDGDAAYGEAFRAAIAEEGLGDRVEIIEDIDEKGLVETYDRADLFALVSRLEGYGSAYAEALAHGLPVLAGAGEAAAALVPAAAGGLVPPDVPATIAAALRPLLADPDARARAARASRSAGTRLPRWFQCADVFEHLMEQPTLRG